MAVEVEVLLELEKANQEAEAFTTKLVNELKAAADKSEDIFNQFSDKTEDELRELAQKAKQYAERMAEAEKRAAKEAEQHFKSMVSEGVGALGDLTDAFGLVSKSVLGLSEAESQAVEKTSTLVQKGITLGSMFGPWGAAIGGVAGALLGWADAADQAAEAEEQLTITMETESRRRAQIAKEEGRKIKWDIEDTSDAINKSSDTLQEYFDKIETLPEDIAGKALRSLTMSSEEFDKKAQALRDAQARLEDFISNPPPPPKPGELLRTGESFDEIKKNLEDGVESTRRDFNKLVEFADKGYKAVDKMVDENTKKLAENERAAEAAGKAHKAALLQYIKQDRDEEGPMLDTGSDFFGLKGSIAQNDDRNEVEAMAAQQLAEDIGAMQYEQDQKTIAERRKIWQTYWSLQDADEHKLQLEQIAREEELTRIKEEQYNQQLAAYQGMLDRMTVGLGAITGTISENIEKGNKAFEGMGKAVHKGVSDSLKAFAKEWTAKAIAEAAAALASLAIRDYKGAAQHAAAAAEYGVAAGIAGYAGAKQAAKASSGDGASGGGNASLGRAANNGASGPVVQTPTVINLQMLAPGSQRQMEEAGAHVARALSAHQQGRH